MEIKDYDRIQKKRKEYIHQSRLLLAGNDVCKVKYYVCMGTLEGGMSKIGFSDSSSGTIPGIVGWKKHVCLVQTKVFLKSDLLK